MIKLHRHAIEIESRWCVLSVAWWTRADWSKPRFFWVNPWLIVFDMGKFAIDVESSRVYDDGPDFEYEES